MGRYIYLENFNKKLELDATTHVAKHAATCVAASTRRYGKVLTANVYRQSVFGFSEIGTQGQQCPVGEFNAFIVSALVELIGLNEESKGIQWDGFPGIEDQRDGAVIHHANGEKRGVVIMKIYPFTDFVADLAHKVALCIPANGAVEVVDNPFVREAAVPIVPVAPAIHPEYGFLFGDHDVGQLGRHCF